MGEGVGLRITNFDPEELFTWRQIHTLVKALDLFLVEGQRPYSTKFKFCQARADTRCYKKCHGFGSSLQGKDQTVTVNAGLGM